MVREIAEMKIEIISNVLSKSSVVLYWNFSPPSEAIYSGMSYMTKA